MEYGLYKLNINLNKMFKYLKFKNSYSIIKDI